MPEKAPEGLVKTRASSEVSKKMSTALYIPKPLPDTKTVEVGGPESGETEMEGCARHLLAQKNTSVQSRNVLCVLESLAEVASMFHLLGSEP
jgi:hypothetical protein